MNIGRNVGQTLIDTAFDDLTNHLHNEQVNNSSWDIERDCDRVLYDKVTELVQQFYIGELLGYGESFI